MKNRIKNYGLFFTLVVVFIIGILPVNTTHAQEVEDNSMILSVTEFTIKPGHNTQFREGIKAWKSCYLENEGDWTWEVWSRIQGEGNVYALSSFMGSWAEMDDTSDEAGQACQNLAQNLINTSIETANRNFFRTMLSWSKSDAVPNNVINVTYWRVNNRTLFMETLDEIVAATVSAFGEPRGYWRDAVGGDLNAPHFYFVVPFENFAGMDAPWDTGLTVVENELGKSERDRIEANYLASVDETWSFMYRKVDDLSHSGN